MLTGSGGTLTEGQNYMLTCEASEGGSMAYTYMWLKDGSVVSGQTSSTYSFSPLRVTDSGQYYCRVSLGSTSMTSRAVTITIACELDLFLILRWLYTRAALGLYLMIFILLWICNNNTCDKMTMQYFLIFGPMSTCSSIRIPPAIHEPGS